MHLCSPQKHTHRHGHTHTHTPYIHTYTSKATETFFYQTSSCVAHRAVKLHYCWSSVCSVNFPLIGLKSVGVRRHLKTAWSEREKQNGERELEKTAAVSVCVCVFFVVCLWMKCFGQEQTFLSPFKVLQIRPTGHWSWSAIQAVLLFQRLQKPGRGERSQGTFTSHVTQTYVDFWIINTPDFPTHRPHLVPTLCIFMHTSPSLGTYPRIPSGLGVKGLLKDKQRWHLPRFLPL